MNYEKFDYLQLQNSKNTWIKCIMLSHGFETEKAIKVMFHSEIKCNQRGNQFKHKVCWIPKSQIKFIRELTKEETKHTVYENNNVAIIEIPYWLLKKNELTY